MRIAVLIPAYHRLAPLITLVNLLDQLSSGQHEVDYRIAVDTDDYEAQAACEVLQKANIRDITVLVDVPAPTLGEKINSLLDAPLAELYAFMADDQVPIVRHWDAAMVHCRDVHRLHAWCWNELGDHGNTTYPTITVDFLRALGGQFFCEWFPYWFIDGWLDEVHELAFGHRIPIIEDMPLAGRRGKTSGGIRNAEFWFDFFAATRCLRIREAERVTAYFGSPVDVGRARQEQITRMEQLDATQLARCHWYREQMGYPQGEPSARYKTARARAQQWLNVNRPMPASYIIVKTARR